MTTNSDICAICGKTFTSTWVSWIPFVPANRRCACIVCRKEVCDRHTRQQRYVHPETREILNGPICERCFEDAAIRKNTVGGTVFPQSFAETRRQIGFIKDDLLKNINAIADEKLAIIDKMIDAKVEKISGIVDGKIDDISAKVDEKIDRTLAKSFRLILILYCFSIFLVLVGLGYYVVTKSTLKVLDTPMVLFRLSTIVMVVIPTGLSLLVAVRKAAINRSKPACFQATRCGRPLIFWDYLTGFLRSDEGVENIWGPIALTGALSFVLLWVILQLG